MTIPAYCLPKQIERGASGSEFPVIQESVSGTVFVVVSESGSYEDRTQWVSGVYDSLDAAKSAIALKCETRKTYDEWYNRFFTYFKHIHCATEAARKLEAIEQLGEPEPESEPAESCEVFEVTLGEWQSNMLNSIWKLDLKK